MSNGGHCKTKTSHGGHCKTKRRQTEDTAKLKDDNATTLNSAQETRLSKRQFMKMKMKITKDFNSEILGDLLSTYFNLSLRFIFYKCLFESEELYLLWIVTGC